VNDSLNKILRTMIFTIPPWIHGTVNGYRNYDCRCFSCCLAASKYDCAYRARQRMLRKSA
jgi:hypothetical protein